MYIIQIKIVQKTKFHSKVARDGGLVGLHGVLRNVVIYPMCENFWFKFTNAEVLLL